MTRLRCCLPNCTATGMTQHRFPNPRTHHALFLKWLEILNMEELRVLDPDVLYMNKRLCFAHFEAKHKSSGNPRLHVLAVPSLNLPGMVKSAADPIPSTSAATDAAPDINILNIILGTPALADPIPSKSAAGVLNTIISTPTSAVTPEKADETSIKKFCDYLRIPTVHPDIDYDDCVKFLKNYARELDLPVQVFTFVPRKPIVIITWKGLDLKLPTILLNSHTDVVPVFEDQWTHPPFAAEIDSKGNIFARGTQDMKCVGIMYLEAIRRLIGEGVRLKRTIHLSFVPDEEIGGQDGMATFVNTEEFRSLNIAFAMDEGVVVPIKQYPLFYGEKVLWHIHVHCRGTPGHGCSLHKDTPGEKFRYIINKFLSLRDEMQARKGENIFPEDDVSSINLTRVYGGVQENVVPDQLTAVFDLRISIKEDLVKFEEQLKQWCVEAGPNVHMEFIKKDKLSGVTPIDDSNPFWTAFNVAVKKLNITLAPITCPGNTDSRYIRDVGISSFGFTPVNETPLLLHGHDEFINKDKFLEGIKIYQQIFNEIGNV